jgi:(p)ppGpp synthase/HD superfamily hydrolase
LSQENRVETMAEKLGVYAERAGVRNVALVTDAYHIAMQPRLAHLAGVFHPDMLHPARNALILIENVGCSDANVLAAAAVTETLSLEMRVPGAEIRAALGASVAELAAQVPDPLATEDSLIEELVTAQRDVVLIALAERLDHARHLHMRDPSVWHPYFEQTVSVYLPVAERVNDDLFNRYHRWMRGFARRLR